MHYDDAGAWLVSGLDIELRVVGGKSIDLVDALLQITQVQQAALDAGKYVADRNAVGFAVINHDFVDDAFDDEYFKVALGQVLWREVGAGGNEALVDIVLGDLGQYPFDVTYIEAAASEFTGDALAY